MHVTCCRRHKGFPRGCQRQGEGEAAGSRWLCRWLRVFFRTVVRADRR